MSDDLQDQLRMVAQSAQDFVRAHGGPGRARQVHEGAEAFDGACWTTLAGLGWLGIAVPEADGGLGLGAEALCAVAEEAGRALLVLPLTTSMAAAAALASAGSALLAPVMAGSERVALAELVDTPAGLQARLVPDTSSADHWLVALGDGAGFEARLLPMHAPSITRTVHAAVDGSRLTDAVITPSAWAGATPLLAGEAGQQAWQQARQLLWLADAAYLCGLMDAALQLALDYLRVRQQFGVPIGSFQALQHRAATCHVDTAASRALVREAARAWNTPKANWAAAAAIHRASTAALRVTKEVVQFHGAIGFADEHDAGLYLRRAMAVGARHERAAMAQLRDGTVSAA